MLAVEVLETVRLTESEGDDQIVGNIPTRQYQVHQRKCVSDESKSLGVNLGDGLTTPNIGCLKDVENFRLSHSQFVGRTVYNRPTGLTTSKSTFQKVSNWPNCSV